MGYPAVSAATMSMFHRSSGRKGFQAVDTPGGVTISERSVTKSPVVDCPPDVMPQQSAPAVPANPEPISTAITTTGHEQ